MSVQYRRVEKVKLSRGKHSIYEGTRTRYPFAKQECCAGVLQFLWCRFDKSVIRAELFKNLQSDFHQGVPFVGVGGVRIPRRVYVCISS